VTTLDATRNAVDAAVLAHRANPCPATKDALLDAMVAHRDQFFAEQTIDFMHRTMVA
jgi:hypothetical protein